MGVKQAMLSTLCSIRWIPLHHASFSLLSIQFIRQFVIRIIYNISILRSFPHSCTWHFPFSKLVFPQTVELSEENGTVDPYFHDATLIMHQIIKTEQTLENMKTLAGSTKQRFIHKQKNYCNRFVLCFDIKS